MNIYLWISLGTLPLLACALWKLNQLRKGRSEEFDQPWSRKDWEAGAFLHRPAAKAPEQSDEVPNKPQKGKQR